MHSRIAIAAVITTSTVLAIVIVACARGPQRDPARATAQQPAGPALLRARAEAHDMLARHCGSCHEGHQPTAKPAALAVFDLDKPDWPARFDAHRFEAALGRLASKPDADKTIFVALRDAELASRAKL